MSKSTVFLICIVVFLVGVSFGDATSDKSVRKYFYDHSQDYLENNTLDLPEEISEIKDEKDGSLELLEAYRDSKEHIIHIRFANSKK